VRPLLVVGARPQFIKAAPLIAALREAGIAPRLLHTGQHYDAAMSAVFFTQLELPRPDVDLGVGSGPHGAQTAAMMTGIERELERDRPDTVVVFGDTNSTVAGAVTAAKMRVPLAHVEAGLRSFNRAMPEELNRIVTDHVADVLFAPTPAAVAHLAREGLASRTHETGDIMVDALRHFEPIAEAKVDPLGEHGLRPREYLLATVHRAENTDDPARLAAILDALTSLDEPVVFPAHPRVRAVLERAGRWNEVAARLRVLEPQGYLETLLLEKHARLILTDSGGVQKEAYLWGVPCITLRDETEWVETVDAGWNLLTGADARRIREAVASFRPARERDFSFGDGRAARRMTAVLEEMHRT